MAAGTVTSLADWTERLPTITDPLAVVTQAPTAWLWSRLVFSFCSLFTVWGAFALARTLSLSRAASLLAAAVVAVSPVHVTHSTTATVDALGLAFATWALVCLVRRYPDSLSRRGVAASALLAGIAVAVKLSFIPVAAIIILGAVSGRGSYGQRLRLGLWSAAVLAVSFVVASPFSVISFDSYVAGVATELWHYAVIGHDAQHLRLSWGVFPRIWRALAFPGYHGWILLALAAPGGAGLLVTGSPARRRRSLLLLAMATAWALALGRMIVFFDRTALPFLLLLAVSTAGGLDLFVAGKTFTLQQRARFAGALMGCVAAVAPVAAWQFEQSVRQWRFVDSRERLVERLIEEAGPGQTVAVSEQLPLYRGALKRHGLKVTLVDPVADPCWFTRESYDYFATSSDPGPGWPEPVFKAEGRRTSLGQPFASPQVRLYPRRPSDRCRADEAPWYAPRGLDSGPGIAMDAFQDGRGYIEFGYSSWLELALDGSGGELVLAAFDAEAVVAGRPRTGDRPALIARVIDNAGEDVCWSVVPLGSRAATALSCRLEGWPPWRLGLSFPASVEWGREPPWLVRVRGIKAAVLPAAPPAPIPRWHDR